jgi:hypothetical protein
VGTAGEYGRTGTVDLLVDLLRLSPREARVRVGRARDLGPRRAITGQPLEPILPMAAEAQRVGEISAEHASVIIRVIDRLPGSCAAEFGPIVERALVEHAQHVHPGAVAKAGELLLARIDPDGTAPRDEDRERRREFGIRMHPDGCGVPLWPAHAGSCCGVEPHPRRAFGPTAARR